LYYINTACRHQNLESIIAICNRVDVELGVEHVDLVDSKLSVSKLNRRTRKLITENIAITVIDDMLSLESDDRTHDLYLIAESNWFLREIKSQYTPDIINHQTLALFTSGLGVSSD